MLVLVDFDNLPHLIKGRAVREICTRALAACSSLGLAAPPRARIRLYGGWFDDARKTKRAEELSRDPDIALPFIARLTWMNRPIAIRVSVELAYSLDADRTTDLYATFRIRSFSARILVEPSITQKCTLSNCSLRVVQDFLRQQRCPSCSVTQGDFLLRAEQKLVDTMIVSDLLYHSQRSPTTELVIISSDDDMWPGIRTAIAFGRTVVHVQTKNTSTRYASPRTVIRPDFPLP